MNSKNRQWHPRQWLEKKSKPFPAKRKIPTDLLNMREWFIFKEIQDTIWLFSVEFPFSVSLGKVFLLHGFCSFYPPRFFSDCIISYFYVAWHIWSDMTFLSGEKWIREGINFLYKDSLLKDQHKRDKLYSIVIDPTKSNLLGKLNVRYSERKWQNKDKEEIWE